MDGRVNAKPTLAVLDGGGTAKTKGEAETLARLYGMLKRVRVADARWRPRALEGVKFYHATKPEDQWDPKDIDRLKKRGQPVITINRIKPTTRLVHGLVVSQPVDILAKPVGKNDDSVADTATAALKYVNNINDFKGLRELVYFDSLTYGMGVAMPGLRIKNRDRRAEPVQMRHLDPREVRLDPQSRETDISDARFVVWSRKVDLPDAQNAYPKFKTDLAKLTGLKDANLSEVAPDSWEGVPGETPPVDLWKGISDEYANWNQADKETDPAGVVKQIILHELWERYPVQAWLYERADGSPCEFEGPDTPEGMRIVSDPAVVTYYQDTVYKVRYFVFCGHLLLHQAASPYKHDRLPFVFCFNERDQHGDPVSWVESLKDVQREINHRRSKALHDLNARPMRITQEALDATGITLDEAADHGANPNAMWVGPDGSVSYLDRGAMEGEQFQLYQDAKAEMQSVSGANDDLMGYDSSSKSGVAKQIQMDQGQMMMRPSEAGLRRFDRQMAELTLMLVQQAHTEEWTVRIKDEMGRDRFITLNRHELDPETQQERVLDTIDGYRFELELEEMPWTPTLRQRSADMVGNMARGEQDPHLRQALQRIALQVSDMPEKGKMLDVLGEAAKMMMQAPPPPPPKKTMADIVRVDLDKLRPEVQAQFLGKEWGIQVDPTAGATLPATQQGQESPSAPPPGLAPTPDKLLAVQADLIKHGATLSHQATQAALDRQHGAGMAQMDLAHGLIQDQHQAALTPPPPPGGGSASETP